MNAATWTCVLVAALLALQAVVGAWARARSVRRYYVADRMVPPALVGMASAAEWISAASFLSLAGLLASRGRDGSAYLVGWTGGFVLLGLLLGPLRRYGKLSVPQFVAERYGAAGARLVALGCAVVISLVYVVAQIRGAGVVFARFLGVSVGGGVALGTVAILAQALLGGRRGTSSRVVQYGVVAVAFLLPAAHVSLRLTGQAVPAVGLGAPLDADGAALIGVAPGQGVLQVLDHLHLGMGLAPYTSGVRPRADVVATALALVAGTAGLPHVIARLFAVPRVRDARASASWALLFVALLYTAAPAVAAFSRAGVLGSVQDVPHARAPAWFASWEATGLVQFTDRDGDGRMRISGREGENEVRVDPDVLVLAAPEMAGLPAWVVGLVATGALAAALSGAAGLLAVIGSAVARDLGKSTLTPNLSERNEQRLSRTAAVLAVLAAGRIAVHPPGSVAQVAALAFGLAAASLFPALVAGLFWKRASGAGAAAGMAAGFLFTGGYIAFFRAVRPDLDGPAHWWLGISPEGIGAVGMVVALAVLAVVSLRVAAPPSPGPSAG